MISKSSKASQVLEALEETKNANSTPAIPVTAGLVETHTTRLEDAEYRNSWFTNPLMKKLVKHTAAQDETSQINELAAKILDYGKASTIGRSICSVHYTDKETLKVRMPKEGKAKKTAGDTWSINTKGQRNEYVEVDTDRFLDAGDEWTTAQVEDTEYDYLMAQTQEAMYNLSKLETTVILDKFKSLESQSGIAGKIVKGSGNNEVEDPSIDLLISLKDKLDSVDRNTTAYVMAPSTLNAILKTDNAKNGEFLTTFYDYQSGMINATFLGARINTSTLFPADKIYCLDTNVAMLYALRRDSLIEPYTRTDAGLHGIRITSRYGLEFGRKDGFAVWV